MSAEMSNPTPEILVSSSVKRKTEGVQNSIDGPDLVPLLQCLGFVLQGMEKNDNHEERDELLKNKDENVVKVEITCVKSGTKATLLRDGCSCKCPQEDAQVWNITAMQGNISVSKSDLVPTISSAKSKVVTTLLSKCIEFILSQNANESTDAMDEFKQAFIAAKQKPLECLKLDPNLSKITLGTSPPKGSSSPIPDLCKSLKNSRSSLEGNDKLPEVLKCIDKLVKQAMELTGGTNVTFTKTPRTSDVMKISPLAVDCTSSQQNVSSSATVSAALEVPGPSMTPASNTPKKSFISTGVKKKGLVPPSRLNLLKYKRDGASPSFGRSPSSSMVKDRPGKSLNLSTAKLKNAISVDSTLQAKLKPRTPIFGSKIAMKK